jgi:hypothetical protein
MKRIPALALACGLASVSAQAAYVDINAGLVTRIYTYSTFGNGDVAFLTQNTSASCSAFWFNLSDPGGKAIYSQLLAAKLSGQTVRIGARDDQRWSGSAGQYCRVDFVGDN